jgi:hypothetical protein
MDSFAEIAKQERKVERHIRLIAPLAFVSPAIITGILNGIMSAIPGHRYFKAGRLFLVRAGNPPSDARNLKLCIG